MTVKSSVPSADLTPAAEPAPRAMGPILAATDGSEASEAALAAAEVIARSAGARVEAVSAVEPFTAPLYAPELVLPLAELQEREEVAHASRIARQLEARPFAADWPTHVAAGRPAEVVARQARKSGASLIVAAYGRHGMLVRMFGTETPLAIAREADVPVLCVPPGFAAMPRTIVVGVDLGTECVHAANAARPLLAEAQQVHLVHVGPKERIDMPVDVLTEWQRAYESEIADAFARATAALALPSTVRLTSAVLRGAVARELLDFTVSAHADLLVAGHGRRGRLERLIGGSVASQLFRGAQCALLLAPERVEGGAG